MIRASIAVLLSCEAAFAAATLVPTIDQSLNMKTVSDAQISPDGRYVAYLLEAPNWDDNEFVRQIWITVTATGERYQLTSGKKSSTDPRWAPDSRRLAFASERDGKRQIYVISATGGEAAQLTTEDNGIGQYEWSPDGTSLAFTSTGPESKLRKDRNEKYGEFDVIGGDYVMKHLWMLKVPTELPANSKQLPKPQQLTKGGDFTVSDFAWSPDGAHIAFSATRDPDLGSQDTEQLYVLDCSDLHVRKLMTFDGPNGHPKWSPDGKQIAFSTSGGQQYFYYANRRIAAVPADGGLPRILTPSFDEDADLIDWGPGGIYFAALQKTNAHLFSLDPASGNTRRISGPDQYYLPNATFTKDHRTLAAVGSLPNQFAEVILSPVADFAPKALTDMAAQWKDFRLGTRELVEWKSVDGAPIEGILIKPADYDPSRKYPLLVVIHGGPTGVDRPVLAADRYYPVERFAAKGALILRPNYRGSAGYGEKFRSLNVRNLGLGDYQDVISGVDALIAKGLVDKDRVASMGWSEGGYISAFITTYSDRFRAVSVGAGISDWVTYYVNTDIHPFTRQYLKATPWDDPEIYRKTSPITYVNRAKTPTLIQQGDQDKRVPPPDSYELYQALKDRGVPTKLIFYKGFGHAINKPKQQRAVMEQNYEWFSKYIWGDEVEAGSATAGN